MLVDAPHCPPIVSVDWLALSCCLAHPYDGAPFEVPNGWSVLTMGETPAWLKRFFIMDELGNKVATILTEPRMASMDRRRALVEIANRWLYHPALESYVDAVLTSYPMAVDGVNRVDLCADFEMSRSLWEVVACMVDSSVYLKGLRRGNIWWTADGSKRVPHQLAWGGRDSTFKWKLYNKWKELHEGGTADPSKPYIEDMWREAGMDAKSVWRLEVSVTSCNQLASTEDDAKIFFMDWYRKRLELYTRIYGDKFVLRERQGHKDKRNDPIVHFLDFEGAKAVKHAKPKGARESDCEKRVVVKMWKEYNDGEVRANDFLWREIGSFLRNMCQFERNVYALCRRFNLSESEVFEALAESEGVSTVPEVDMAALMAHVAARRVDASSPC